MYIIRLCYVLKKTIVLQLEKKVFHTACKYELAQAACHLNFHNESLRLKKATGSDSDSKSYKLAAKCIENRRGKPTKRCPTKVAN